MDERDENHTIDLGCVLCSRRTEIAVLLRLKYLLWCNIYWWWYNFTLRWNIYFWYILYHERKDMAILLVLGNSLILKQDFVTFFYPQQTVHLFVWFHIDWLSQLHNNVLGGEDGFPTLFTVYSKIRLFANYFISNHLSSVHRSYCDVKKTVCISDRVIHLTINKLSILIH